MQGAKAVEDYITNLDDDIKQDGIYDSYGEDFLLGKGDKKPPLWEVATWSESFEKLDDLKITFYLMTDGYYNDILVTYLSPLYQMRDDTNSTLMDKNEKAEFDELINKINNIFIDDGDQVFKVLKNSQLPMKTETYTEEAFVEKSTAGVLRTTVSAWYVTLRNIALVALLSVLVYIGIRITLSSVANDKAKYKQMLIDWVVAICLVLLMHYIMSFSVYITSKITDMLTSISFKSAESEEIASQLKDSKEIPDDAKSKFVQAVELYKFTNVKVEGKPEEDASKINAAWDTLVGEEKDWTEGKSSLFKNFFFTDDTLSTKATSKDAAKVFIWPANNFIEQARIEYQLLESDGEDRLLSYGYGIIYVVLIIYTIIFSFTYLRRVIYMAFLTMIAPLVAITYPIDKMNDGKAQAFDLWLKEYLFNLLLQPLHLALYIIVIGSAMNFAAKNVFYVIMALGFLMPAEKLLRRFFGFEKAQTPGAFGGAAGAALMMSGLNKLRHPSSKGGLGAGGNNSKDSDEEGSKPPKNKDLDATQNLIGEGANNEEENVQDIRTENTNSEEDSGEQTDWTTSNGTYTYTYDPSANSNDMPNNAFAFNYTRSNSQEGGSSNGQNTVSQQQRVNPQQWTNPQPTNGETQPKRKKSLRRAIGRGARNYQAGLQKRYQAKKAAKGGMIKRGIRLAGGLAAGTTLAAAGGLIGITSGDPSKAAQYIGAGAGVGYALGKAGVNKVSDTVTVKDTLKEAKKGYYGDEYKDIQKEKYKKQFIKDEENLKKIEEKMHVEREEAKKIANRIAAYTQEKGIDDVESALAVYQLVQKEKYSLQEALTAASYNNRVLEGKDTRHIRSDDLKEHKQSFKDKLVENGKNEADAEMYTNNLFTAMNKFNQYKN